MQNNWLVGIAPLNLDPVTQTISFDVVNENDIIVGRMTITKDFIENLKELFTSD